MIEEKNKIPEYVSYPFYAWLASMIITMSVSTYNSFQVHSFSDEIVKQEQALEENIHQASIQKNIISGLSSYWATKNPNISSDYYKVNQSLDDAVYSMNIELEEFKTNNRESFEKRDDKLSFSKRLYNVAIVEFFTYPLYLFSLGFYVIRRNNKTNILKDTYKENN